MEKRGEIIEVSFNVLVTDEDIDDIMVSALEGGINHCAQKQRCRGNISESSPAIRSAGEERFSCMMWRKESMRN